jgi:hypothetical protein
VTETNKRQFLIIIIIIFLQVQAIKNIFQSVIYTIFPEVRSAQVYLFVQKAILNLISRIILYWIWFYR